MRIKTFSVCQKKKNFFGLLFSRLKIEYLFFFFEGKIEYLLVTKLRLNFSHKSQYVFTRKEKIDKVYSSLCLLLFLLWSSSMGLNA